MREGELEMRPERRGGGVAAELMAGGGGGARPSLWRTPTPYLYVGFAFMMGLIAVVLLVLICKRRKPSRRRGPGVGLGDQTTSPSARALAPLDREPKVVVIMAGDDAPSFLASAKTLVVPAPATPGGAAAV